MIENFPVGQRRHRSLILLTAAIGFEMEQETSCTIPACLLVVHMNIDNAVFCSYFWLLKDDMC